MTTARRAATGEAAGPVRVLYHQPSRHNLYAGRFIYEGYRDAFTDLGHDFHTFTNLDGLARVLDETRPDLFITGTHGVYLKALDMVTLQAWRERGLVVFANTGPLEYPTDPGHSLSRQVELLRLVRERRFADAYFSYFQPERMADFERVTDYRHHTVLLAANKLLHFPVEPEPGLRSDAVFIGAYLPRKRETFRRLLDPLRQRYDVRVYGRDWTRLDRWVGVAQRASQFLNLRLLDRLRTLDVPLDRERAIYSSTKIGLNIHERQQRALGEDFNERTFKILACGAFELCDDVAVVRRYFKADELVTAGDDEWLPTFDHYVRSDDERRRVQARGTRKVLEHHTYHNRVDQLLGVYAEIRGRGRESQHHGG
jgi:spore maturation protein CgeB